MWYKTLDFPTGEEADKTLKEVLEAFDKKYAHKTNEDVQCYLLFSTKQNTDEAMENLYHQTEDSSREVWTRRSNIIPD